MYVHNASMKKDRQKKERRVELRLSVHDDARIRKLAELYAGGNISKWITYAALNAPRKIISKKSARAFTRADPNSGKIPNRS